MYTSNDLSYIAGIVDGEGCIDIGRQDAKKSNNRKSPSYQMRVSIQMGELETITFISDLFQKVYYTRHKENKFRTLYTLRWSSVAAYKFLKLIVPFMKGKQQQAQIAIQFYENTLRDTRYHCALYTPEEIELREIYYQHMKFLKHGHKTKTHTQTSLAQDSHTKKLIDHCKQFLPQHIPTKEELTLLYNTPMSCDEMGIRLGRTGSAIWYLMKKYQIPRRTSVEATILRFH